MVHVYRVRENADVILYESNKCGMSFVCISLNEEVIRTFSRNNSKVQVQVCFD